MDLPQDDPRGVDGPGGAVCLACHLDLAGVAAAARFCPRCGGRLVGAEPVVAAISVAAAAAESTSALNEAYRALRDELEGKLADPAATAAVPSSVVVLAYANAMLNLGWRYAHGRGLRRNEAEAGRCYAKAGRLSGAWGRDGGNGTGAGDLRR